MKGKGKSSNDQGSSPASSMPGLEEISGSTLDLELHPKMILTVIRITAQRRETKRGRGGKIRGDLLLMLCLLFWCLKGEGGGRVLGLNGDHNGLAGIIRRKGDSTGRIERGRGVKI